MTRILTWEWINAHRDDICAESLAMVREKYPEGVPLTNETADWCAEKRLQLTFAMWGFFGKKWEERYWGLRDKNPPVSYKEAEWHYNRARTFLRVLIEMYDAEINDGGVLTPQEEEVERHSVEPVKPINFREFL